MSDYDPVQCLREEVERFKRTNAFSPMLVTNFYAQAACVLTELERVKAENLQLRAGLSKVASNIGNGSAAAPGCSLGFLCDAVPVEVKLAFDVYRQEREDALRLVDDIIENCSVSESHVTRRRAMV